LSRYLGANFADNSQRVSSCQLRFFKIITNGEKRNVYRLLVRNPEGKRPLGRPRRRWIDNYDGPFRDRIECCGLDWSGSG
jgi:hypothetical protein